MGERVPVSQIGPLRDTGDSTVVNDRSGDRL